MNFIPAYAIYNSDIENSGADSVAYLLITVL